MREHGGLVIADEVQSGLGRAGSNMWAFMDHGLTPDIVTLGKVGVYIDIYNIYTIYISMLSRAWVTGSRWAL